MQQDDQHEAKTVERREGSTERDDEIMRRAKEIQVSEWRTHGRRLGFGKCVQLARRAVRAS